jgi:hypothetical protein
MQNFHWSTVWENGVNSVPLVCTAFGHDSLICHKAPACHIPGFKSVLLTMSQPHHTFATVLLVVKCVPASDAFITCLVACSFKYFCIITASYIICSMSVTILCHSCVFDSSMHRPCFIYTILLTSYRLFSVWKILPAVMWLQQITMC